MKLMKVNYSMKNITNQEFEQRVSDISKESEDAPDSLSGRVIRYNGKPPNFGI
jgi:hypothetical protein